MSTLTVVWLWVVKVTYFYLLSPWLLIPFGAMVFVSVFYKYHNWSDNGHGPSVWRYCLPHALIDCSVWPIALIGGFTLGVMTDVIEWVGDWGDSIITTVVVFADTLAFTYIRQGQANLLLAILVALAVGIDWRLALWIGIIKQDPEHFFDDQLPKWARPGLK